MKIFNEEEIRIHLARIYPAIPGSINPLRTAASFNEWLKPLLDTIKGLRERVNVLEAEVDRLNTL